MMKKIRKYTFYILLLFNFTGVAAQTKNDADDLMLVHRLQYVEREPGVDDYPLTLLVSKNKIRIDETNENSGYIVYDDEKKVIYSVSHHDQSILIINEHEFSKEQSPVKYKTEYKELSDAPMVDGKKVFNYRVYIPEENSEMTCMEIQLIENLLPEVRVLLQNYQKVISGQQVKMTDNKISQVQSACYFVDQIYNTGSYYDKGLPIQEWHSNERSKILQSFNKVTVDKKLFNVPEDYHQFSIDKKLKSFIN